MRNPTRRNRNIGTAKRGHGQDNRHSIPTHTYASRSWKETLHTHQQFWCPVGDREVCFIIEENARGCVHACTVDDIRHVLEMIPSSDWVGIECIVLRQPTAKQATLNPVWGRLSYTANLGAVAGKDVYLGPVIMLDACPAGAQFKWPKSLGPEGTKELARLRDDGHQVIDEGRHYLIATTPDTVRSTQLYRTLLHEIGHWLDFLQKVERRYDDNPDSYGQLVDRYFQRPQDEREAFAHRYADEMRRQLVDRGIIPFERDAVPKWKRRPNV